MKTVKILCANNGLRYETAAGTTLAELAAEICPTVKDVKTGEVQPVLAALVDHALKSLDFSVMMPHEVQFIGYGHPDGRRTYLRSLCFVLQNAVSKVFPGKVLIVDHSLPGGLYCEIRDYHYSASASAVSDTEIGLLKEEMDRLISADLPFTTEKMLAEEAEKLFLANRQTSKVGLLKSLGKYFCNVYFLDGRADTFHGPLVASTGCLKVYDLVRFADGFCLQYPDDADNSKVISMKPQENLSSMLRSYTEWCNILGIKGVGSLNKTILEGGAARLINLAEARHERKFAQLADRIYENREAIKIVFIAGPSSSGKTSSSLRLAQQCKVLGLNPKVVELDNYFVEREKTPKDENGEYDYEALGAMDLDLLGQHLNDLLAGRKVEIPKFDFKAGKPVYVGNYMQLGPDDILIMEGIHALNPDMVPGVDQTRIFRVYASALTSLNFDENNNISTSDNRLLRRMIRDNRVRGISPEDTILRWPSVRRGESRNIFPFQENADAIFNSALIFELPLLKYYAEPLLRRIAPNSPAYTEAVRLLKFLDYIVALQPSDIAAVPPASIIREFIGGQIL